MGLTERTMPKEHIEIIDGKEFKVTVLPKDRRTEPARAKKRALWNRLTSAQKKRYLEEKRAKAKMKRRRRK